MSVAVVMPHGTRIVKQNQPSFLNNSLLVYANCVSKDDFPIDLAHFQLCEADLLQNSPKFYQQNE